MKRLSSGNREYSKAIKKKIEKLASPKEVRVGWSNHQFHKPNKAGEAPSYATLAYILSTGFEAIYPYDNSIIRVPPRPLLDDAVEMTPMYDRVVYYIWKNMLNLDMKKVGKIMYDNIMTFFESNPYENTFPNSDRVIDNKKNQENYPWLDTGELIKHLIIEVVKK